MAIRFGRTEGKGKSPRSRWMGRLRSLLSGIFMTLCLFLFLLSFSQILIHGMSVLVFEEDNFQNWWSGPVLPFLFSLAFLVLFLLLNYDRVPVLRNIAARLKGARGPKAPGDIEIPEFD